MIWPATSRYARRLVEFLIAVILAKFVIVAIIGLASAAITNAGATGAADDGQMFERMIAGAALLVLAAWSPFALLRLIPMMEIAAAGVVTQRSSMSGAAGSAGVHSPASYMRQAMDRHSHGSASPAYPVATGTIYSRAEGNEAERTRPAWAASRDLTSERHSTAGRSRSGSPSGGPSGATYPAPDTRTSSGQGTTAAPREQPSPPHSPQQEEPQTRPRPPEPRPDVTPPTEDR
jgi:hypothetical protein